MTGPGRVILFVEVGDDLTSGFGLRVFDAPANAEEIVGDLNSMAPFEGRHDARIVELEDIQDLLVEYRLAD